MKIGVYGGTFSPPHLGHMTSARCAMEALGLDKLIFIPAATPPHKELPPDSPSARQRLEMVTIAADSLLLGEKAEVSDLELQREGKSYTADTAAELRKRYPDDELWLLMGSDMFLTFHTWYRPEQIAAQMNLAAFARAESDSIEELETQASFLRRQLGAHARVIRLPEITEISSTQLREMLPRGSETAEEYLPAGVFGYILMNRLYGTDADLTALDDGDLLACVCSMIRAKRIAHICGTRDEAVRLAERYGGDVQSARRAAILHDCTKYYTTEEHLAVCDRYGIELDEMERTHLKLLHAKTGAALARARFGVSDEIYDAIFYHTTGKADMTLLEKILYIADYMEPTRDFPGVELLREVTYRDLDEAVLLGMEMTIQEMEERGQAVHRGSLSGRNFLLDAGVRSVLHPQREKSRKGEKL